MEKSIFDSRAETYKVLSLHSDRYRHFYLTRNQLCSQLIKTPFALRELFSFFLLIRAIKFFSVSGITSFQLLTPKLAFAPDSIEAAPTSRHFLYCFDLPAAGAAAFPSMSSECIIPRTGDFFMKFKIFLRLLFYASRPRTALRIKLMPKKRAARQPHMQQQ